VDDDGMGEASLDWSGGLRSGADCALRVEDVDPVIEEMEDVND